MPNQSAENSLQGNHFQNGLLAGCVSYTDQDLLQVKQSFV